MEIWVVLLLFATVVAPEKVTNENTNTDIR